MKLRLLLPLLAVSLLLGCSSFTTTVRKSQMSSVQLGYNTMQGWASYYVQATNNPAKFNTTLADLNKLKDKFDTASVKLGTASKLVDLMLASYATNGVGQVDVSATLSLLGSNAAQILIDLQQIIGK